MGAAVTMLRGAALAAPATQADPASPRQDQAVEAPPVEITNGVGDVVARLTWQPVAGVPGAWWCMVDDGTLTRHPGGSVTTRLQAREGGVRQYEHPSLDAAWFALGLTAHRCNGLNAWRELDRLPGTAGKD